MGEAEVHAGRDGWLFLTGGSNRPLDLYAADPRVWWLVARWRRLIEARWRRFHLRGARFLQVVVPEKLSVYDHRAGLPLEWRRAPSHRLAEALARSPAAAAYLDLLAPMRAARDDADLFHRTDSHWSFAGCHLAYREICRALGAEPVPDFADRPHAETDALGDLGIKFDPPRRETSVHYSFQRDAVLVRENALSEAIRTGTLAAPRFVGAHAVFTNAHPAADRRRVVLFGDSYAQTVPNRLTGMLAETFRELHFIWSTSLDWRYLDAVRPDIVLCELAERFLTRVPDDRYDVSAAPPPA